MGGRPDHTIVARHDGSGWQVIPAPSPGTGDAILGGIAARGADLWAVGVDETDNRDPLVEHHHGT